MLCCVLQVIVDMREFRSSLPFFLYQRGMRVIPATLEVGDYVLAPDICVERKSLSDLIGSFASGRLFNQMVSLCRTYKAAVLLIEFDPEKPFALMASSDLPSDVSARSTLAKVALLVLHFPRVRLVWSNGPHMTASVFASLKQAHPEPDAHVAAVAGTDHEAAADPLFTQPDPLVSGSGTGSSDSSIIPLRPGSILPASDSASAHSLTPQEILRSLPGVNAHNFLALLNHVKDLKHLTTMTESELAPLMGGQQNARKLRTFLESDNAVF